MLPSLRISSTLHGWDPLRIVAQIVALQCIHYILLAAFVPPLLSILTERAALRFVGGPAQVGMLIDWHELSSLPTWDWKVHQNTTVLGGVPHTPEESAAAQNWTAGSLWIAPSNASAGQTHITVLAPNEYEWQDRSPSLHAGRTSSASTQWQKATSGVSLQELELERWEWQRTHDARRGYAILLAWTVTAFFDVQVLYYIVRKPTHILDFVTTMHLINLLVTWIYAGAIPVSLFWWSIMFLHGSLCVVFAERISIEREMRVGFADHEEIERLGGPAYEMSTRS
ncbi:hypothetical protein MVES1_000069 [Malassezia vespertilionis]|uniref:uncharacterized protein n=1 Tax=Malassezia vespertilionis TaxID=2020962 RepID=UPI0024B16D16|nr:uncharacterized protein MVES1_000069 [Malassezia vespertilionis]WFD04745.1 hypothetical protein MVES1_000069 [Malassezia vespertilionis]